MPIYEYRRPDGTTFEVMQKFSDDPLTVDPESGEPVERVFRPPAIHFKGSGFHNTDYGTRRRPVSEDGGGGSGGSDGAPSNGAGKSEAGAASSGDSGGAKSSGKTVGLDKV